MTRLEFWCEAIPHFILWIVVVLFAIGLLL